MADYAQYRFTELMDATSKVFLDLALEYQDVNDFGWMAVLIPKIILNWDAAMYLSDTESESVLVASTRRDIMDRCLNGEQVTLPVLAEAGRFDGEYRFPMPLASAAANQDGSAPLYPIVGMFVVCSGQELSANDYFFLQKYVDLVTLSVVQRLLAKKGQQHLAFIRTLVADIGHNVIVPNIFFKAYLRRLGGKIERLSEIQEQLKQLAQAPPQDLPAGMRNLAAEMAYANEGLQEEFDHIRKHYVNTSLFLETLLRQSHFEKGRYVLQKKTCNFNSDIIGPQVEQYLAKLKAKGIEIDISMGGVPDQVIEAVVDIGLISQVFANLLSNAVKYTRPAPNDPTNRKFIAYGLDLVHDAFGPGEEGVKINLFSSGKSLDQADVEDIFQEGRRGSNIESERGTGHGLFFVKEVVELHGGITGYEATPMGNNFYFILPR